MHASDTTATCENCASALRGRYCHECGQAAANPLRHFGHAVEDFFESFWHLDGRVFRTLRDLFVPGRVACNYLAGQRVRYIAPLRLFVVTTVLTFFLAGLATPTDEPGAKSAVDANPAITAAKDVEAVGSALSAELARIELARAKMDDVPGVDAALDSAEARARQQAAARMRELGAPAARVEAIGSAEPEAKRTPGSGIRTLMTKYGRLEQPGRAWDAESNPVDVGWLPGFGDRWFNHRAANAVRNANEMQANVGYGVRLIIAALPTALFMLVPVFALLLKLLYWRSDWSYLEHLVVALYSHVFLLVGVVALALMAAVDPAVSRVPGLGGLWDLLRVLAALSLPAYLLVMQKRVYRQGRTKTAVKYVALGGVYVLLVAFAAIYALFAGLTSGG